jgi:hypothetical protein
MVTPFGMMGREMEAKAYFKKLKTCLRNDHFGITVSVEICMKLYFYWELVKVKRWDLNETKVQLVKFLQEDILDSRQIGNESFAIRFKNKLEDGGYFEVVRSFMMAVHRNWLNFKVVCIDESTVAVYVFEY